MCLASSSMLGQGLHDGLHHGKGTFLFEAELQKHRSQLIPWATSESSHLQRRFWVEIKTSMNSKILPGTTDIYNSKMLKDFANAPNNAPSNMP